MPLRSCVIVSAALIMTAAPQAIFVQAAPTPVPEPMTSTQEKALLDAAIAKGLHFLDGWQLPHGEWDRLEDPDPIMQNDPQREEKNAGNANFFDGPIKDIPENKATANVADTCLSAMAMLRSSQSGTQKDRMDKVARAVAFVCHQVEIWDDKSIYIQDRIFDPLHDQNPALGEQRYFDPTVDTFFALWFLSQVKDITPKGPARDRVNDAIEKLTWKIKKYQDLTGPNAGRWADSTDPILAVKARANVQKNPHFKLQGGSDGTVSVDVMNIPGFVANDREYEEPLFGITLPSSQAHVRTATHAAELTALNEAVLNGVPIPAQTRLLAVQYLRHYLEFLEASHQPIFPAKPGAAPEHNWQLKVAAEREKDAYENAVTNWGTIVAALQSDEKVNLALEEQARQAAMNSDSAAAKTQLAATLKFLDTQMTQDDLWKKRALDNFIRAHGLEMEIAQGPLLSLYPVLIQALTPTQRQTFHQAILDHILAQQNLDGHFRAGRAPGGPYDLDLDRGDNAFGTATKLLILMDARADLEPKK